MKKITRNIATLMILTLAGTVAKAQVVEQKVGDNNLIMNQNAVLEIESTNKGLLLPRIALEATDSFAPLTAHVEGMTVYNTATAGTGETAVTPGYYYNDGTQWVRVATGADAKTEPWFVHNTTDEATENTDDIYQNANVGIGDFSGELIDAKLKVKGNIVADYDAGGNIYSFQTGVFDAGNILLATEDGQHPILGGSSTVYSDLIQSPTDFSSSVRNTAYESGLSQNPQRFEIGAIDLVNTQSTELEINANSGIDYTFNSPSGLQKYTFPKTDGDAGQVLVTDGVDGGAQLSWTNVSDLVEINEPWRIQNTTDDATANTDNIYQQGKVAIGFTDADSVSEKQLEVKGDFRTATEVAGRDVAFDTNIEGSGIGLWYNADDIDNPTDMGMIQVHQNSVHLIAQSPTNAGAVQVVPGLIEYRSGNWGLTDGVSHYRMVPDRIILSSSSGETTNADNTAIHVRKGEGMLFVHNDENADLVGGYIFPRNSGTLGQVLGVQSTNVSNTESNLAWIDIDDLVDINEPWKIQNTTDDATANTDNIYQQGKVAIGFESTDAVSDKQLEVKGDFESKYLNTDDNYVYGLETNKDNGLGIKENMMYVANDENLAAATHSSFLGLNKDNVAFMNRDRTGAVEKFNAVLVGNQPNGGLVTMASETSDGKYGAVGAITWTDDVEASMQTRQTVTGEDIEMDLLVRPKTGISFKHQGPTGYGAYTFPTNSPTEGQVLVGSATTGGSVVGRQLEWKDVSDLVKAAMPKFFYMPSVEIPTHNTSTGILLTGTQTIDLYASYTEQFSFTGGVGQARSNNASTIPTIPADELDYFITYFDTDVFQNVAVSTEGVLTYSVKSDAVVTPKTFMNIVFKVRD